MLVLRHTCLGKAVTAEGRAAGFCVSNLSIQYCVVNRRWFMFRCGEASSFIPGKESTCSLLSGKQSLSK